MKQESAYLRHILDSIARIEMYTRGGRGSFDGDPMIQDAVVRNLEIIGEAVKHLSAKERARQPAIPWTSIAGFRDILIHEYFGIRLATVWDVVEHRLPPLKAAVNALLEVQVEPPGVPPPGH